ncbi:Alpha/beta hydrolase fold [Parasponia andersonii]|uniref:Alpha/beta hydrolase fold n=1 Tax=Parasponia andersonii TaxID=3476 RepID=A0A2P5A5I4_PARAD|nr:Alpha/beta hydrolase fold [Parasponia andersonii]
MASNKPQVSIEAFPYLRVYKDGTIERLAGTEIAPTGLDPQTGVVSKDIVIVPETGVEARLYRPELKTHKPVPLVVYFHGGGFFISSTGDPYYHNCLNRLTAEAQIIIGSVNYRLAPENPLPASYEDCWAALRWVASHTVVDGGVQSPEPWIKDHVDFDRVFIVGDSAGANIAHHVICRIAEQDPVPRLSIAGVASIHPYFWGVESVGSEADDPVRKEMVDRWWSVVCHSDKGNDDPLINPFVEGAPRLEGLAACRKMLVLVAEKDILRDRGWLYYEKVAKSTWGGTIEIAETPGVDHVFHILDPDSEKAKTLIKRLASFVNQQ